MKRILVYFIILLTAAATAWAQSYPVAHGANERITHGTHYPKTVSIQGTQSPQFKIENIATAPRCAAYFDKTSTVFEVKAGDIVTPDITINGDWMHGFVFVDWNQDGQFRVNLLGDGPYSEGEGNELTCYSHYHKTSGGNDGWNSAGEAVGGNVLSPGRFRVPGDAAVGTTYRMRYSVTWNCADPSGNYANFLSDGGSIIDVTLKIAGKAENVQKYPIDDYEEPTVEATAPAAEWNALAEGLHCSWASRDVHYQKHLVPQLTETSTATVSAWKGERANLEAVLFSNQEQGSLAVRMTEWKKDGAGTGRYCATARFLNYVITDDGRGCGNHNFSLGTWLVPDVIEQDKPKVIHARETRPVWCSIEVPRDIEAGVYATTLEVTDEGGTVVASLNLNIEVVDRSLPEAADRKFHLDLWQQPYAVSRYYDVERWSDEHIEALRPYLEALGKAGQSVVTTILFYEPWGDQSHDKFSPMIQTTRKADGSWAFDYSIFDRYVELCDEYGINKQINCYSMVTWDMKFRYYDEATGRDVDWSLTAGSSDYNALWDAYLKAFRTHLEEKGWFAKTCIAMDERSEQQMLAAYEIIRANGFKMALAGNYHSSLNDKLHDFCVALTQGSNFTAAERKYRKDNNLITTVYTSCSDAEPNIYSNSLPAEAAFLPIHVAANDLDGYLHWSWINWDEHPLTDTRFRKFGAGDTYCYYPGNRSSVRFERLVEGIHQFEKVQIMRREMAGNAAWMDKLNVLLDDCKDCFTTGPECAAKVDRLEAFLNGKEIDIPENTLSGYWKIKVDDTHFAKAKANLTQWNTELSVQPEYDLFQIEGTTDACTIKLMGRSNNIGPDGSMKLFVDQTTATKYSIVDAGDGKVRLQNGRNWVYVNNGTFTFDASRSTELMLEYVMPSTEPKRTTLFSTLQGGMDIPPYRIPGITCGKDGRLIASAARLVCGTDPGYGQVDCVVKISDDDGMTWSSTEIDVAVGDASLINNTKTPMEAAYGDPAVVMDREHDEVLVMAVGGCTVYTYGSTTRQNPNIIASIRSLDGGQTWQTPVELTEDIYGLFDDGNPMAAAFVGGGRIFQSRIVKVGEYYRLYAALAARPNGNRVVYSDDFGRTWKVLGAPTDKPVPNGDEPKCEELPDGRVVITSRTGSGRLMNIYTYSNTRTGAGRWETETKATMSGLSASPSSNPTNGEMLIVPARRNSDGRDMYVALQSVPTGSGRNDVGIFYKELAGMSDIRDVAAFTAGWDGFYQVSSTASAYSSIELQADDKIAFFYEETLTKWGSKPNPVSTSFPTGAGTHNYDGFENIYVPLELELITGGRYSVCRDVDRGEYLRSYYTDIVGAADMSDDDRARILSEVDRLPAEPTIDQLDAIRALFGATTVGVAALQKKIDAIIPGIEARAIGYPRQENADVQTLMRLQAVTPQNYEDALAAYDKVVALADVNLPVSGKAYTIAIRKSDGTDKWYIKGTGFTATAADADVFVCGKADSGDYPYVFVTNDNLFLTSRGVSTTKAYTRKANDFKAEAMVGHSSTYIDRSYPTFGTICLTAQGRTGSLNTNGTIILRESNARYDNSTAPYLNGQFTSALVVEEACYPYNNVEFLKGDAADAEALATVCLPFDMQVPAGIEVYKATEEHDADGKTYLRLARVNDTDGPVAKGAYILRSESTAGGSTLAPSATKLTAVTDNLLVGSTQPGAQRSTLQNPYVLTFMGTPAAAAFCQYDADGYPLGKAVYDSPSCQADCLYLDFGDVTDAISTLRSEGADSRLFDLSGRRIDTPTALHIANGRKQLAR